MSEHLKFDTAFLDNAQRPETKKTEQSNAHVKSNKKKKGVLTSVIVFFAIVTIFGGLLNIDPNTSAPTTTYSPTPKNPTKTGSSYSTSTWAKKGSTTTVTTSKSEIKTPSTPTSPKKTVQPPVVTQPPPKSDYEICQEKLGKFSFYDSEISSCSCVVEYQISRLTNQCVSLIQARNDSCAVDFPNTEFLRYDKTVDKNICDCKNGYYWNNDRTGCYTQESYTQGCQSKYGEGSYSTTENNKRVCDCTIGYSFNIERDYCITNSSIHSICERDVGRNSYYLGYVENGKYMCSEPY